MFEVVKTPFFEMAAEVGSDASVPPSVAAEGQTPSGDGNAPTPEPTNTDSNPTDDDVTRQESFAKRLQEMTEKRLREERQKWEQEQAEKYKDYDVLKKAAEYLQKTSGINDIMTLKERIELEELQERAEQQNVPPEVLKRLDELEAKAAKAEEYERIQAEERERQAFEQSLIEFCKDKEGLDHNELWQYMYENGISKPEVAYKAMKADELEKQLENAKKEGVKEFLSAKGSMPKVEGAKASGQVLPGTPKTFQEARQRALQRFGG